MLSNQALQNRNLELIQSDRAVLMVLYKKRPSLMTLTPNQSTDVGVK